MRRATERSFGAVPNWVVLLLLASLTCQYFVQKNYATHVAAGKDLPVPPTPTVVRLASLDSPIFAAQLLMLWLQSFDVQPGISLSFRELDYARIQGWLKLILNLHPHGQYPLLSAARVYAEVDDPPRQRAMLAFVADQFEDDPARRWQWLAHAVYVAKHRLKDRELALQLAERLAAHRQNLAIPSWATQMNIFVLEDMGEIESAKVLLGGLLESGQITDPHERWFLSKRLAELEQKSGE